jgi:hypothetical protein
MLWLNYMIVSHWLSAGRVITFVLTAERICVAPRGASLALDGRVVLHATSDAPSPFKSQWLLYVPAALTVKPYVCLHKLLMCFM